MNEEDFQSLLQLESKYVKKWAVKGSQCRHKAIEFGLFPSTASAVRVRYLWEQIVHNINYHDYETFGIYEPSGRFMAPKMTVDEMLDEIFLLSKPEYVPKEGEITPEVIQQVKQIPIDTIIEFARGKIRCLNPEHEDNNPTMYHGTRTNMAICPACGVNYDTIKVVQIKEGLTFHEAVRRLWLR